MVLTSISHWTFRSFGGLATLANPLGGFVSLLSLTACVLSVGADLDVIVARLTNLHNFGRIPTELHQATRQE